MSTAKPPDLPVHLGGGLVPIQMWADPATVEQAAIDQVRSVARLPWIAKLAVMPDVHVGKGATVGSVVALRGAVSPACVGVDIGCGMAAVRTSITADRLPDDLGRLRTAIEAAVPVGRASRGPAPLSASTEVGAAVDHLMGRFGDLTDAVKRQRTKAGEQIGSLGGGNHFVEVCVDGEDRVWLMLHSGSRGIGNILAQHHIAIAQGLGHNQALGDKDLAVFLAGTPQMDAYRHDLYWAQEYAALNRAVMLDLVIGVVRKAVHGIQFEKPISCHHNYVAEELLEGGVDGVGEPVFVTRKGAIRAGLGEMGLIPGSMGTGSYVVRGRGNAASQFSASHGAGRRMSRTAARKRFTTTDLVAQTQGVECRKDQGVVDEIPGAYKDLDAVLAAQSDLVEVVARLQTVLCVKG